MLDDMMRVGFGGGDLGMCVGREPCLGFGCSRRARPALDSPLYLRGISRGEMVVRCNEIGHGIIVNS